MPVLETAPCEVSPKGTTIDDALTAHTDIQSAFVDALIHTMCAVDRDSFIARLRQQRMSRQVNHIVAGSVVEADRFAADAAAAAAKLFLISCEEESCRIRQALYKLDDDFDGLVLVSRAKQWLTCCNLMGSKEMVRLVDVIEGGRVKTVGPEKQPTENATVRQRFYALDERGKGVVMTRELLEGLKSTVLVTHSFESISLRELEQHLRARARSRKASHALCMTAALVLQEKRAKRLPQVHKETALVFRDQLARSATRLRECPADVPSVKTESAPDEESMSVPVEPRYEIKIDHVPEDARGIASPAYVDLGTIGESCGPVMHRMELQLCVIVVAPTVSLQGRPIHAAVRCSTDIVVDLQLASASDESLADAWQRTPIVVMRLDGKQAQVSAEDAVKVTLFDTLYGKPLGTATLDISEFASRLTTDSLQVDTDLKVATLHTRVPVEAFYCTLCAELCVRATLIREMT